MRLALPTPSLVILCGPAASGKSTFARAHFPPTAIVSSDRCRAMIADDEASMAASRDAFALFHQIIESRLRHRRLTVADSTALHPEARRTLRRLARRADVPVILIIFDVSEEMMIKWNEGRARRVARPVLRRQWEQLQEVLRTAHGEGYDRVIVLGEADLSKVKVEVHPAAGSAGAAP